MSFSGFARVLASVVCLAAIACGETESDRDVDPYAPCKPLKASEPDIAECTPGSLDVAYPVPWRSDQGPLHVSDGSFLFGIRQRRDNPSQSVVFRMDKRTQVETELAALFQARSLVSYGDALLSLTGSELSWVSKDGGWPKSALQDVALIESVAVQDQRLALIRFQNGGAFLSFTEGSKAPFKDIPITLSLFENDPTMPVVPTVVLVGDDAYLIDPIRLRRISLSTFDETLVSTLPATWTPTNGGAYGIVPSEERYEARLIWLPTGSSEPITIDTRQNVLGGGLVVDERNVYWLTGTELRRYSREDGKGKRVVAHLDGYRGIFSDQLCVYVASECGTLRYSK